MQAAPEAGCGNQMPATKAPNLPHPTLAFRQVGIIDYLYDKAKDGEPDRRIRFFPDKIEGLGKLTARVTVLGGEEDDKEIAVIPMDGIFVLKEGALESLSSLSIEERIDILTDTIPIVLSDPPKSKDQYESIKAITIDLSTESVTENQKAGPTETAEKIRGIDVISYLTLKAANLNLQLGLEKVELDYEVSGKSKRALDHHWFSLPFIKRKEKFYDIPAMSEKFEEKKGKDKAFFSWPKIIHGQKIEKNNSILSLFDEHHDSLFVEH